tara:strand:- start:288 stop:524 length:237 start_codon:yes stop_codon:yes gene_type:complete
MKKKNIAQIDENSPIIATSITIKKPECNPFTGEWGYTETEYKIKDLEVAFNEDGEAFLTVFGTGNYIDIPVNFSGTTN